MCVRMCVCALFIHGLFIQNPIVRSIIIIRVLPFLYVCMYIYIYIYMYTHTGPRLLAAKACQSLAEKEIQALGQPKEQSEHSEPAF